MCNFHSSMLSLCFPNSNRNKCQKSNYFPWKKKGWGMQVSYGCIIRCGASCKDCYSCFSYWQQLAGAEMKTEQNKTDPASCRADWGEGKELQWQVRLQGFI